MRNHNYYVDLPKSLTGYLEYKDQNRSAPFDPIVPHNAFGTLDGNSLDPQNPLLAAFGKEHIEDIGFQHCAFNIIQNISSRIVAISLGRGEPLGTGLLLNSNLVLTARHCVEGRRLSDFTVRRSYQKIGGLMNLANPVTISGCVEQNEQLDYAILLTNQPFRYNVENIINFVEEDLSQSQYSLFFHHPNGGAKKVSLHRSLGGCNEGFSSFHDTEKGSSGGIYVSLRGNIFAMHSLRFNGTTYPILIRDIIHSSIFLQKIINDEPVNTLRSESYLKPSNSQNRPYWERVCNPIPHQNVDRFGIYGQRIDLTHHHIIPIGDMQFLWIIAKETPLIERFIISNQLYFSYERGNYEFTINSLAYAPWDLFTGPTKRSDDPGGLPELNKPRNFPRELWDKVHILRCRLNQMWDARFNLYNQFIQIQRDQDEFRTQLVHDSDIHEHEYELRLLQFSNATSNLRKRHLAQYNSSLNNLFQAIKSINETLSKRSFQQYKQTPHYNVNDWDLHNGKYRLFPDQGNQNNTLRPR